MVEYNVEFAPDVNTEETWVEQLGAKVREFWLEWQQTEVEYNTMVGFRSRIDKPLYSDGWDEDKDQQYWAMNTLAHEVHDKMVQVYQGGRRIGAIPDLGDIAVLGSTSEIRFRVADGVVYQILPNGSENKVVDSAGFVGATPVPPVPPSTVAVVVAVAVVLVTAGIVVAAIPIVSAIRDYIVRVQKRDSEDCVKDLVAKGNTVQAASLACSKVMQDQVDIARALGEKNKTDPLNKFFETMQVVVIGGATVAAIGGIGYLVWKFWPTKRDRNYAYR